eukprot:TRINITY_DN8492_c0_g1_i1.p1 TRINITY_DN8492_c0_g1~~TRINITY_DN8492_c0_g1_i1.p1  ORF type:complete len:319 (-),score=70.69 TRINITY_DN8492_c0_g1_i1:75-1031(-)
MASPLDQIRETTEYVVRSAEYVKINHEALLKEVEILSQKPWVKEKWGDNWFHYYEPTSILTAQYVLVLDSLNFCFWQDEKLEYHHLASSLKNVLVNDSTAFDAEKLSNIDVHTFRKWMGGLIFPLEEERVRLVREIGLVLKQHFDGKASVLIEKANKSVSNLVQLVTAHFPGFRDSTVYKGKQVFLYKRAQIFAGDIWGAYDAKFLGEFHDLDQLTMFADYRVPQVLQASGVLEYNEKLWELIKSKTQVIVNSEMEIEIRAATVQAVEIMKKELNKKFNQKNLNVVVTSLDLDWLLWGRGESMLDKLPPHHRTLTIFY